MMPALDTDKHLVQEVVSIMLSLIPCTKLMVKEFRSLIYQLASEMNSEIKHAEMLTITVMKVSNSDKRPLALFETKILDHILFAGGEISALLIEIVAMRDWRKQQKCV